MDAETESNQARAIDSRWTRTHLALLRNHYNHLSSCLFQVGRIYSKTIKCWNGTPCHDLLCPAIAREAVCEVQALYVLLAGDCCRVGIAARPDGCCSCYEVAFRLSSAQPTPSPTCCAVSLCSLYFASADFVLCRATPKHGKGEEWKVYIIPTVAARASLIAICYLLSPSRV